MKKLRQEVQELALNHPDSAWPLYHENCRERSLGVSSCSSQLRSCPIKNKLGSEWGVILCPKPWAFVASRGPVTFFPHSPTVGVGCCPLLTVQTGVGLSHSPKHALSGPGILIVTSSYQAASHLLTLSYPMHTLPWNSLPHHFHLSKSYCPLRPGSFSLLPQSLTKVFQPPHITPFSESLLSLVQPCTAWFVTQLPFLPNRLSISWR